MPHIKSDLSAVLNLIFDFTGRYAHVILSIKQFLQELCQEAAGGLHRCVGHDLDV